MIFSEDAPALEAALHRRFASRRVNLANTRKEFFFVTLDELREAVEVEFGDVTFTTTIAADEYRETLAQREDDAENGHGSVGAEARRLLEIQKGLGREASHAAIPA